MKGLEETWKRQMRESPYYNPAYTLIRNQGGSHLYADTFAMYYASYRLKGDNHYDASAKAYRRADAIVRMR